MNLSKQFKLLFVGTCVVACMATSSSAIDPQLLRNVVNDGGHFEAHVQAVQDYCNQQKQICEEQMTALCDAASALPSDLIENTGKWASLAKNIQGIIQQGARDREINKALEEMHRPKHRVIKGKGHNSAHEERAPANDWDATFLAHLTSVFAEIEECVPEDVAGGEGEDLEEEDAVVAPDEVVTTPERGAHKPRARQASESDGRHPKNKVKPLAISPEAKAARKAETRQRRSSESVEGGVNVPSAPQTAGNGTADGEASTPTANRSPAAAITFSGFSTGGVKVGDSKPR